MGYGLSLSMGQELKQTLSLSQKLEQRLEAKLAQQLALSMSLEQYLGYETIIQTLISHADEHKTWNQFDKEGFLFSYATVPYKLAQPIADNYGPGFAHCLYHPFEGRVRGQWTLFVVPEMIVPSSVELVAIHERGEELSLGNHYFATQLEFAYAQHTKNLKSHVGWIDTRFPSKFVDLTQKVLFPILPEDLLADLQAQGKRNASELETAEKLITHYPLPCMLLKKMHEYSRATETVCKRLQVYLGLTQHALVQRFNTFPSPTAEEAASIANRMMRDTLDINPQMARVISHAQVSEWYDSYVKNVGTVAFQPLQRHFVMPPTFLEAYRLMQEGKKLVTVHYTSEDLARRKG